MTKSTSTPPDPSLLADAISDARGKTDQAIEPQDAASILIYDATGDDVAILMGQRGAATQFMPNRYVFPGGRVDPGDRTVSAEGAGLEARQAEKLLLEMAPPVEAARAQGLAIAAVRETFEEAGLVFGHGRRDETAPQVDTEHGVWGAFARHAAQPDLQQLVYFARAITPPGQKRRYDTRFFCAPRSAVLAETGVTDGELSKLDWYPLPELEALNLAPITKAILGEFKHARLTGALEQGCPDVPFYYQSAGIFRRDILRV
jgi:8-oxo-dGTP pyrophosphatase MutT (NUDIX family)